MCVVILLSENMFLNVRLFQSPLISLLVTGSSFFVFSGALKASSGYTAKTSIVEGTTRYSQPLSANVGHLIPLEPCLN